MRAARPDYLELQLQLAAHFAQLTGSGIGSAVSQCTNFRRRFGLEDDAGSARWHTYLQGLSDGVELGANLQWTLAFQARCPLQPLPALSFGCFSFEPLDSEGTVRVHYRSLDPAPLVSPLARAQVPQRREESAAMFRHIRRHHPEARAVRGGSWLYHLEAYNRLFPDEYVRSAAPARHPLHLNGTSTWGQVVDWREHVKPAQREQLQRNLHAMDPEAPWRVFPLQCLVPYAPIECFSRQ